MGLDSENEISEIRIGNCTYELIMRPPGHLQTQIFSPVGSPLSSSGSDMPQDFSSIVAPDKISTDTALAGLDNLVLAIYHRLS